MNQWKLNKRVFGPLWKYIKDDEVTDVDWDGEALWVSYARGSTIKCDEPEITQLFINNFSDYVANHVSCSFNQINNTLSAETDTLRITIVHESFATSGRCFSIRKSMPKLRFTIHEALEENYCNLELMHFLVNCVKLHKNFVFCGEPGHGKTEAAKFFSTFIEPFEKVITVEDTLEWHYKRINKGKNGLELKVNEDFDYIKAIKTALRLNPTWLMLSEARSREAQYVIEAWSTNVHGMATAHTGKVENIPDRFINMMDADIDPVRMKNTIYEYLNIGVLLEKITDKNGNTHRRITEVGLFSRDGEYNRFNLIYKNGTFNKNEIPSSVMDEFLAAKIKNPFFSQELEDRINNEEDGNFYGQSEDNEWDYYDGDEEITTESIGSDENGLIGTNETFDIDEFMKSIEQKG